jgi:2-polyprenyl-6-methoxyphenol hydroxylase-like FAD-dependent oxidoreductase
MSARKPITIVGGGLAGLTLGIGLRQRDIPVTLWEAGAYPRHRVCGEFISGRGQGTLERLGLRALVTEAGAIPACTTAFFSARAASAVRELSEPAISISRFTLDDLLAKQFQRLGGELRAGQRWRAEEFSEGVIRATGRRVQAQEGGWRWFGLKAHALQVSLTADLEMHLSSSGYLGISRLPGGQVNICGLFRRPAQAKESPLRWQETLRGEPGTARHARLREAVFDEASFCSIAGLSLQPRQARLLPECALGDAITMIPPVTGNGMSMAFESAEIAIAPLAAYSESKLSWREARECIAQGCDETFGPRLAWAAWLQRFLFMPRLHTALVLFVPRVSPLWRLLLAKTR